MAGVDSYREFVFAEQSVSHPTARCILRLLLTEESRDRGEIMKRREFCKSSAAAALVLGGSEILGNIHLMAHGEDPEYRVAGTFVDGCACNVPCPCTFAGKFKEGCNNIGLLVLTSGRYKGVDLAGAKMLEAGLAGTWVRIYVDATQAQREAAVALAKSAFSAYGTIEAVNNASIDFSGEAGKYKLSVDGGKVVEMTTEPVLGVDGKTPIVLTNVPTAFASTVMQARTIKAFFRDGDRSFTLASSNATFNDRVNSEGRFSA
jgi:hypothetical protein